MSHQERKAALRQRYERLRKAIPVELADGLTLHVRPLMIDERDYVAQLQKANADGEGDVADTSEAVIAAWLLCDEDGTRLSAEDREEYKAIFETGTRADYLSLLNAASGVEPPKPKPKGKEKDPDAGN